MTAILECKACPFCGSLEVSICRTNEAACWVECDECGCRRDCCRSRKGAISRWNNRIDSAARARITSDDNMRAQQ